MMSNIDFFKLLSISIPENYNEYSFDMQINGPIKTITISTKPKPMFCPHCNSIMHSKGIYTRSVRHPVLQDGTQIILKVKQRRWKCTGEYCTCSINEEFPFLERHRQTTNTTPFMILNAMKDLNRSTASIAQQYNVSDTYVHDIFTAYVDLKRLPLPIYLSVDEVFLNFAPDMKYQLVLMDFKTNQIVDILPNRYQSTFENYLLRIPLEERLNVRYFISDAYSPYFSMCKMYFPNAVHILDSFHDIQAIIVKINNYINTILRAYQEKDKRRLEVKNHYTNSENKTIKESQEVILLRNYRWIILKNNDDITYSYKPHYHKSLKMYLTTGQIEDMFFKLHPNFLTIRVLKEKYIQFNKQNYSSSEETAKALDVLIAEYANCDITIFRDFSVFLSRFREPIIHSFNETLVSRNNRNQRIELLSRLSNGPMEGFNRLPKDLKRLTRGMNNFDYNRNRILWATRINPPIRSIPKTKEQIHSYKLSKSTESRRPKKYKK
ncbi:MAG: transposase [Clostridium sp.]